MAGPWPSPELSDGNRMLARRESLPSGRGKWRLAGFCILSEPGPPGLVAQPPSLRPGWPAPPGNRAARREGACKVRRVLYPANSPRARPGEAQLEGSWAWRARPLRAARRWAAETGLRLGLRRLCTAEPPARPPRGCRTTTWDIIAGQRWS
ncbi:hypothetical protein NN561_011007 [Cricetulus griseus]